jgi:hypothetical protein
MVRGLFGQVYLSITIEDCGDAVFFNSAQKMRSAASVVWALELSNQSAIRAG